MILEFVKGFLTLFLLIKVLLYFVPKNVFEKYMRIFGHGCRLVIRFPSGFLNVSSLRTTLLIILLRKVNSDENV